MKFLLLCQFQPAAMANAPADAMEQVMASMMDYNEQLLSAKVLVAAGQLASPDTAKKVYAEQGKLKTVSGMALGRFDRWSSRRFNPHGSKPSCRIAPR